MSTRGTPLNGKIVFVDANGANVGNPVKVSGEGYFWTLIPKNAASASITSLDSVPSKVPLVPDGSTFVSVNPTQAQVAESMATI